MYVVAWLSCLSEIFCASHITVSWMFRLADCTLEKQLSTQEKLDLGLILACSNGFEPKGRFLQIRTQGDNLCSMFHSVCCLFHAKPCRLSDREESSVFLTIIFKLLCKP